MAQLTDQDERALAAFFGRVERLRAEDLLALAAQPLDGASHAAALERAAAVTRRHGLDDAVDDVRRTVDDWVLRLFNRSTVQPGWYEANWGRPGTVEDRANLAASLGEAVTAVGLGERLADDDREELLGAWAALVSDGPPR